MVKLIRNNDRIDSVVHMQAVALSGKQSALFGCQPATRFLLKCIMLLYETACQQLILILPRAAVSHLDLTHLPLAALAHRRLLRTRTNGDDGGRRGRRCRKGHRELEAQRNPLRCRRASLHGSCHGELWKLLHCRLLLNENIGLKVARVNRHQRRSHEHECQSGNPCKLSRPQHGVEAG